jgi:glyoxylase-like metal-dependent hydrolase (beta-lactamase superfamily II)
MRGPEPRTRKLTRNLALIDTELLGRRGTLSTYVLLGPEITLVEPGPAKSVEPLLQGLDELSISPDEVARVLVTHVHLDHAGGAWRVAEVLPRATLHLSERGAPHLVEPSKLLASSLRVYGAAMEGLFGPVKPLDTTRVRVLREGDAIETGAGPLKVLETPGHTRTHLSFHLEREGALFTGDAAGTYWAEGDLSWPATPPADFSVERCLEDQARFRALDPEWLLTAHFGPVKDPKSHCERIAEALRNWEPVVAGALAGGEDYAAAARALKRFCNLQGRAAAWAEVVSGFLMNATGLGLDLKRRGRIAQHEPGGV